MPRKKKEELPQIGDFCYLITDSERKLRQIIKMKAEPDGMKYKLACGTKRTWHYIMEMTGDGMERTPITGFKNESSSNKQGRQTGKAKGDKGTA